MWVSIKEFCAICGWLAWVMLASTIASIAGLGQLASETTGITLFTVSFQWAKYLWFASAIITCFAVTLIAFHRIRKQRDKLQSALDKIPLALGTPDSPIIAEPVVQIHLDNFPYATGYGLTDGFPKEFGGKPFWVKVFAEIDISKNTNIETLELKLGNERIPVHREPKLEFQRFHYHCFQISRKVNPGKHIGQLIAKADGKWWASKEFSIEIPKQ
jgi:hypothetical protein